MNRQAKIVCTLGPSSHSYAVIEKMILAGMNVARLNFSHGTHEEHREVIECIRRATKETGRIVGILLDLQGPKIRVGRFDGGEALLEEGNRFTITGREVGGTREIVSTTHARLARDVVPGDPILLDDGLLVLEVEEIEGQDVHCRVRMGGVLKNNKGINLPGAALSVDTITEKDLADMEFGIANQVDFLAMSFVRHPDDIRSLQQRLESAKAKLPIVAKIEKPQALEHIDEIIALSDGIMVARGDLGVELPAEEVPGVQKSLIGACNQAGKPVITATQMLESMVHNPRPTRAEASDVANAILDGSDAVMLSAESASGKYPVKTVEVMSRIICATESNVNSMEPARRRRPGKGTVQVYEAIAMAACSLAEHVGAQGIASITLTGSMSRAIAKHRPSTTIYAISHYESVLRRLSVIWGIEGIWMEDLTMNIDDAAVEVKNRLCEMGRLSKGDFLVFTAGLPFAERQATNMVRVDRVT